jgi:hypothetical protein
MKNMRLGLIIPLAATIPLVFGWSTESDAIKPLTISAEGINATFIGHGARLTHLNVNDKNGQMRDVVLGYDDPTEYLREAVPTYFGPIVGYVLLIVYDLELMYQKPLCEQDQEWDLSDRRQDL